MKPSPPPPSVSATYFPSNFLIRKAKLSPFLFSFLIFVVFVTILYSQDLRCIFSHQFEYYYSDHPTPHHSISSTATEKKLEKLPFAIEKTKGEEEEEETECDLFSGKWIRDEVNRPLYEESDCPYIQPQLTCQARGRPDKDYLYWRWQPHACSLPSFNATLMLETLRGKRMMFVGDSLNRGQFVSMVCLLQKNIPEHEKSMVTNGSFQIFTIKNYNASIEFYWAPFLLESNSDDAIIHRIADRVVRKGSIIKHGKNWKGVDFLVFNTYVWWMTGLTFKILQGSFKDEVKHVVDVSTEDAYRMALKSMKRWVKRNMDPNKTRVFFTGMSPSHGKAKDWGGDVEGNCYNETELIETPNYWGSDTRKSIMQVLGEELGQRRRRRSNKNKVPITFLNITQLSNYRKDAHTSIYKKQWNKLTPEQLANPKSYADCTHWCLPGLQDTWNELLFAKLFYP